jgi:hypothetical protein
MLFLSRRKIKCLSLLRLQMVKLSRMKNEAVSNEIVRARRLATCSPRAMCCTLPTLTFAFSPTSERTMTRKFPHFLPICSSTIAKSVLPVKLRQLSSGAILTNYAVQLSAGKATCYGLDRSSTPRHHLAFLLFQQVQTLWCP